MGLGNRLRDRASAKKVLSELVDNSKTVLVIHYSCESFDGGANGSSPRVTSIAIRKLASGQTWSSSIHQVAEQDRNKNGQIDEQDYDRLEQKMLRDFYAFVKGHQGHTWLHWNMRDSQYGFAAIAHRCKTLGNRPVDIHETERVDLARLLVSLYGRRYVRHEPHGRLKNLIELNQMPMRAFLTGEQEADAFVKKELLAIHQSTLRKVDNLCGIAERAVNDTLKTDARYKDIFGSHFASFKKFIQEHWIWSLLYIVAAIVGLCVIIMSM